MVILYNFAAESFHTKKLAEFVRKQKIGLWAFGGLRGNVRTPYRPMPIRHVRKLVVLFLFIIIELCLLFLTFETL